MSPFITGLLLVLAGLAGVFWGYRIFRILLPIYGGIAGYVIAYNWLGQTSWVLALIVGIVLAIILAVLAYFIWSILFTISGAVLGIALAGIIASSLNMAPWLAALLALVLAILIGWLFWKFRNEMIIIGTVLVGAGAVAEGVGTWFGLRTGIGARLAPNPFWLLLLVAVVWVTLIVVGMAYQWPRYRRSNLWGFGLEPSKPPEAEPAATRMAPAVEVAAPAVEAEAGVPVAAVGAAAVAGVAVAAGAEEPAVEVEAPAVEVAAPAVEVEAGVPVAAVGAAAVAAAVAGAEEPAVEVEAGVPVAAAVAAGEVLASEAEEAPAEAEAVAAEVATRAAEVAAPVVEEAAGAAVSLKALEATLSAADLGNLREKVDFIEGIGEAYAAKLNEIGIVSVMDLLQRGATRKGRAELVELTGIAAGLILKWVNHADLFRITGVGKQFGELLEAAGVDTVVELGQRNPVNLFNRLAQVNTEKKLAGRSPRQDEVNSWVEQAKGLPRVIEY